MLGFYFFELPDHLSISVVMNWLTSSDISAFDNAVCCSWLRQAWLSLLKDPMMVLRFTAKPSHLVWTLKREAKFAACDFKELDSGSEDCLERLITFNGSRLEMVKLGKLVGNSTSVLSALARSTGIKELYLYEQTLSVQELEGFFNLPRLHTFQIPCSFSSLSRPVSNLPTSLMLKVLNVADTGIDDASMVTIIKYSPLVESANLARCSKLTDITAVAIGKHWRRLKRSGSSFTAFRDEGVIAIAQGCRGLELAALFPPDEDPSCLSESCVLALMEHCPNLQELRVSEVQGLTDAHYFAAARCCPKLKTFMGGSIMPAITDPCVLALVTGCPLLEELLLPYGPYVTFEAIRRAVEHCKHLRLLHICLPKALRKEFRRQSVDVFPERVKVELCDPGPDPAA